MKKPTLISRTIRYAKFLISGIFALLLFGLFSCAQKAEQSIVLPKEPTQILTVNPADLPPPVKAKYIDPDSIAPPIVVPLKRQPKVIPAHTNVHPAGTPKVIQIPKDLKVLTPGKDGIPPPMVIPAKRQVVPALQPKPIPALALRTKDAAIYNIKFLSDEQDLTPEHVICMLEDSRGHLWFSGEGYLYRYDGKNFFLYTKKEGFPRGVFDMIEDSKGNIWFAGNGGICYYDGQNIVHLVVDDKMDSRYRIRGCRAVMEDSKGNIWFGNYGSKFIDGGPNESGVYYYDGQNFTIFKEEQGLIKNFDLSKGYIFDYKINDITEDSRGHFWWATHGSGVVHYDGQHITHITQKEGLIDNHIKTILEDSQGYIWFGSGGEGTIGRGLSQYNPNRQNHPKGISGSFSNFTKKEGLSDNRITDMLEDKLGNLWFSTYAGGVNRYDGKTFTHFTKGEGLSFNSIHCILEDSKRNIWVGTNGGGISRIQPNSFVHFTEEQGLSKNWINSILEDSKGNVWMGAFYGGVIKYDGQNFIIYTEKEGLLQNIVESIMEDSKGNLWFATRDKGLSRFDGKIFTNYSMEHGLSWNHVYDMHEDSHGVLWMANGWGGITRINPHNGQFTHFPCDYKSQFTGKDSHGLGGGKIIEDSKGNLWFGSKGYIAKYDAENDQINFLYKVDEEFLNAYMEDNQGNLWFGEYNRLVKLNEKAEKTEYKLTIFNKENGLPNLAIKSVTLDKEQNIWIGSNEGLAVLIKGTENLGYPNLRWLKYGKADGLKSKDYPFNSACLDSKNRLWWGSQATGVTMLDLNTFQIPTEAPKVGLSYIDIQQQFMDYRSLSDTTYRNTLAFGEALSQSFDSVIAFNNYPTTMSLPHDLNHLTFHFSAIDWAAPHKIQYSYHMEGMDKTWSEPTTEAKADYRNLPYGTFTFKVKAIGEAKVWSEPFEYTFTILPPWWHTWWAYGLYALLTFGVSGWYIQRLQKQIRQKQQQLNRELHLNQELTVTNKQLEDINIANSRFVPNDFLKILGKESLLDLKLGDQTEATMTILFADIRDYTTISEQISPEDNFKLINAFLGRMGPIIQKNGGFICQYMGDGMMALFKEKHELAIQAAIDMQSELQRYNKKRFVRNRQALRVGIGLNTGKLMLGVIGDKNRYDSSVISDAVNTASRMEGLTKIFGCGVIVSEKTLAEIGLLDDFPSSSNLKFDDEKLLDDGKSSSNAYRFLGKVKVKGKNQTLKIYDFFEGDAPNIRQLKVDTKADFEQAIHFYFDRKFGKAADLLKKINQQFPEDVATEYYLTKAVKYVVDGVDADWSGVEEMVNK